MGGKFSVFILKSKLEVAVKRMQGQMNKKTNYIKVQRREIAQLLADKKDESARIRVEALLHEIHMVEAMEIVSLMCQLLAARTSLIASEKYMPDDLVEAAASIIFCAKRMEIPELVEIAKQFAFKFTEEWVKTHINNQSEKVNVKVLSKLTVRAPEFKVVINYLTDIAKQYNVAWEPSYAEEADKDANPNALGAIAPINFSEAKLQAEQDDDRPFKPGVLNVTVHEARKLYQTKLFGTMDPYVTLTLSGNNAIVHKTRVMKNSGVSISFHEEYFPFAIKDSGMTIRAEAFTKRDVVADDFIGRAFLSVDQLILNPQRSWYRLGRQYNEQTEAGELLISTQFMPFNHADDQELHQGDAPRFVSPPLGPASGVAAQISGAYSPSPAVSVSPVMPSTNINGFISNGMAQPMPAAPLPAPAAPQMSVPAYAQPPSYSPHPSDSPTPNGFNTYAPQPPSYDAHPDPLAPYQAHNSPPPVSVQPYDLPSVPQSNGPAAARDGPPDFEELEARFRALQKS